MRNDRSRAAGPVSEAPVVLFDRISGIVGYAIRRVERYLLANDRIRRLERVAWDGLKEDQLASRIRQARRVLHGQSYLPFRRCTPVEVGRHRGTGLNRGRPVAKVPDVRNDRSAARTPVAVEGDHVARWDAGNARLVGKGCEGVGGSVCPDGQPYR